MQLLTPGLLCSDRRSNRQAAGLHRRLRQHLPLRLHGRKLPARNEQGGERGAGVNSSLI